MRLLRTTVFADILALSVDLADFAPRSSNLCLPAQTPKEIDCGSFASRHPHQALTL